MNRPGTHTRWTPGRDSIRTLRYIGGFGNGEDMSTEGREGAGEATSYVWHTAVHDSLGERLYYWRLSFATVYDRTKALQRIATALRGLDPPCKSFVIYETFGDWDVLVRCWIPKSHSPEDLEVVLYDALRDFDVFEIQYLAVFGIVRHHAYREHFISDPEPDLVMSALIREANFVKAIDQHNTMLASELEQRLKLNQIHSVEYATQTSPQVHEAAESLGRIGLVAPIRIGRPGVRFHISLGLGRHPLNAADRKLLNEDLLDVISKVSAEHRATNGVTHSPISLYHGLGTFTTHLLTCKAPDGGFYEFADDLLSQIHKVTLIRRFQLKPSTSVHSSRDVLVAEECGALPPTPAFSEEDLAQAPPEDETLEFKASAWFDLHKFVSAHRGLIESNGSAPDGMAEPTPNLGISSVLPKPRSFAAGLTAIAKSVCAFLNSGGGTLIVGVAELDRVADKIAEIDVEGIQAIFNYYGYVPITPEIERPPLWITGLECDYSLADKGVNDWDKWRNGVADKLANSITPNPMPSGEVTITPLELPNLAPGRTVAVLRVQGRGSPNRWHYFDNQFWIRQSGQTVQIQGQAADEYKLTRRSS